MWSRLHNREETPFASSAEDLFAFSLCPSLFCVFSSPSPHYSGTSNLISITREKKTAYISRSRCDTIKEPKNLLQRVHQKRGMYVVFSPYHTGGSRTISAGERNMASRVVLLASTPGFLFCSPRTLSPCTAVSASGDERDPPQKQLADRRTRQAGSPLWHATFALASRLG